MPAIVGGRRAPRPGDRRGLLPGAPGHLRRAAGRQLRRRGRLQLLPDEEPRRARRRRRDDDRRRRARGARRAAAQRRADRSLPPRRVRRELAARRDPGGDPARAAAAAAGLDRRAGARSRGRTARALAGVDTVAVPPEARRRPRLSPVPGAQPRPRRDAGAPQGERRRDADPLPGADPAAAGAGDASSRPTARSPTACAREVFSLPLYPSLPMPRSVRWPTRSPAGRRRRQPS